MRYTGYYITKNVVIYTDELNTLRIIKYGKLRWAGNVAGMGKTSSYRLSF
jgi:hypothetical protein